MNGKQTADQKGIDVAAPAAGGLAAVVRPRQLGPAAVILSAHELVVQAVHGLGGLLEGTSLVGVSIVAVEPQPVAPA